MCVCEGVSVSLCLTQTHKLFFTCSSQNLLLEKASLQDPQCHPSKQLSKSMWRADEYAPSQVFALFTQPCLRTRSQFVIFVSGADGLEPFFNCQPRCSALSACRRGYCALMRLAPFTLPAKTKGLVWAVASTSRQLLACQRRLLPLQRIKAKQLGILQNAARSVSQSIAPAISSSSLKPL